MNKRIGYAFVALALVIVLAIGLVSCKDEDAPIVQQGVSNMDSLHLSDSGGTATPVFMANQAGTGRIMELRDSLTPVFSVNDAGTVDGLVVRYATAGQQIVVGTTTTITDTEVAAHGLTTVTFALCTLGEDVDTDAGDPVVCTAAVSSNVVTLSLWQDDWSAGATAATVHWLVIGTP